MSQAVCKGESYNPYVDQNILGNPSERGLFEAPSQQKRQKLIYQLSVSKSDWQLRAPNFPIQAPKDWRPLVSTRVK